MLAAGAVQAGQEVLVCLNDCTRSIASGSNATLTATPASGYLLGAWSGCQSVNGTKCTVQMTQARTVSVTFNAIAPLAVAPDAAGGAIAELGLICAGGGIGDCAASADTGLLR